MFALLLIWIICWTNSQVARGWRHHDADVISLHWLLVIFKMLLGPNVFVLQNMLKMLIVRQSKLHWLSWISILPFKDGELFVITLSSAMPVDNQSTESTRPPTSFMSTMQYKYSFEAQWRHMASWTCQVIIVHISLSLYEAVLFNRPNLFFIFECFVDAVVNDCFNHEHYNIAEHPWTDVSKRINNMNLWSLWLNSIRPCKEFRSGLIFFTYSHGSHKWN